MIIKDLRDYEVRTTIWANTEPELPTTGIDTCYQELRGVGIDSVIGIGGGSCLDMSKAMALLLSHGGPINRYYGESAVPGAILPVIAVPTTAGTGSEVSPVCVVSDHRNELKTGISSPHLVPTVAIVDPELTYDCPGGLTAAAGADALSHLVEAFTAIRRDPDSIGDQRVFIGKNVISDGYARQGLELIINGLRRIRIDPGNHQARADVMLAANAGGYALGVAGTAAAHALQYPLGALTHTSHGLGVGTLLPFVMRFNAPVRVAEFAEIGRILGLPGSTDSSLATAAIQCLDDLLIELGIPATLKDLGVAEDALEYLARKGLESKRLVDNNPRPLDFDAALAIVRAAYHGDRRITL